MLRIFILDEDESAASLASMLCSEGYVVSTSSDPETALRQIVELAIKKQGPILVLAEFLEVDGAKLCRELRRCRFTRKTAKVVLMSRGGPRSNIDDYRRLAKSHQANDYLLKSDDPQVTLQDIRRFI